MKPQKGLIVAIVAGGLGVAVWAALAMPTAQDAPKVPNVAAPSEAETHQAEDETVPSADRRANEPEADHFAVGESTTQSGASGDISSATETSGPVAAGRSANDKVLGSRAKLKDPRDKYCPPAAHYGDKPKKGCIGDY